MNRIDVEWTDATPNHHGLSRTEWNRLRDRLDKQAWTEKDVERLEARVRRVATRRRSHV